VHAREFDLDDLADARVGSLLQQSRRRPRRLSALMTANPNPWFELVARQKSWRPTFAISPMSRRRKFARTFVFKE